ncbi:TIGR01459 family HAD-type hydrolase [Pararhodobacter sp. SW119]|uniref:TIGR01459 family HAD-type hydrolase n=1 Tax=Pararhodobacter sp. SW119 TaxID=2780075 RepID=UPI001AE0CE76|nr:TIGR01459 family HAD-type hydrolase [Pararhodobacter sp. SW119]
MIPDPALALRPRPDAIGADWTFARYQAVRHLLPRAAFAGESLQVPDLRAVFDRYDAFVLDAFGVLNIGERVIPGAVERIAAMRAAGKPVVVLTNGASYPRSAALAKYARLGFDFTEDEVVASRDIAAAALARRDPGMLWAGITAAGAGFDDLPARVESLAAEEGLLARADGFLFLGSEGWSAARQAALAAALADRPRPVIVANPDVIAPREGGFSLEPGHYAADLPGTVEYYGKPHAAAFEAAVDRIAARAVIPRERIAMVGDTLHTDVLGGRAAGLGTVLIAGHGLFRGHDPAPFIAESGIVPDVIAETT